MTPGTTNLTQIQDALQSLPINQVKEYVNGTNPQVPAFMALSELNRRKILGQESLQPNPTGTIKDNVVQGLASLPVANAFAPQMASPISAPQMANPTVTPQMVNPTAAPQMVNPTAAEPMVNPAAPNQTVPHARSGGLASVPMGMFKQRNFAPGGIVAFNGEDESQVEDKSQVEDTQAQDDEEARAQAVANELGEKDFRGNGLASIAQGYGGRTRLDAPVSSWEAKPGSNSLTKAPSRPVNVDPRVVYEDLPQPEDTVAPDQVKGGFNDSSVAAAPAASAAPAAPVKAKQSEQPVKAAKSVSAPQGESIADLWKSTQNQINNELKATSVPIPTELTQEQAFNQYKSLKQMAGVSEDPNAESKQRWKNIEAKNKASEAQDPDDRLIMSLAAFAEANPNSGIGGAAAQYAKTSVVMKKTQEALREAQAQKMAEVVGHFAMEDDARKRDDMAGAQRAIDARLKAVQDAQKLQNEQQKLIVDKHQMLNHGLMALTESVAKPQEIALRAKQIENERLYQQGMLNKPSEQMQLINAFKKDALARGENMTTEQAVTAMNTVKNAPQARSAMIKQLESEFTKNPQHMFDDTGKDDFINKGLIAAGYAPVTSSEATNKNYTMDDVRAIAKSRNKTVDEVLADAKAKGLIIKP